jgi:hypothetical protein
MKVDLHHNIIYRCKRMGDNTGRAKTGGVYYFRWCEHTNTWRALTERGWTVSNANTLQNVKWWKILGRRTVTNCEMTWRKASKGAQGCMREERIPVGSLWFNRPNSGSADQNACTEIPLQEFEQVGTRFGTSGPRRSAQMSNIEFNEWIKTQLPEVKPMTTLATVKVGAIVINGQDEVELSTKDLLGLVSNAQTAMIEAQELPVGAFRDKSEKKVQDVIDTLMTVVNTRDPE